MLTSTNNRRIPWESSSIVGDFYFVRLDEDLSSPCPPLRAFQTLQTNLLAPPLLLLAKRPQVHLVHRSLKETRGKTSLWRRKNPCLLRARHSDKRDLRI